MNILGIESSCDDTAAAVLTPEGVQSNIISSQLVHEAYGGIVPELASRAHHKTISRTVQQALDQADRSLSQMDAIAVTQGPGLMGWLLVGLSCDKVLALANGLPHNGVNKITVNMMYTCMYHS